MVGKATKLKASEVRDTDREILRVLGDRLAGAAAGQDRLARAELWRRNNDQDPARKMVWITEVPWHELQAVHEELVCHCTEPWLREIEDELRRTLYQWKHFPVDMILDDYISCRKVWHSTGIEPEMRETVIDQHSLGGIKSHHWAPQILGPEDLDRIKLPEVVYDAEETARRHEVLTGI